MFHTFAAPVLGFLTFGAWALVRRQRRAFGLPGLFGAGLALFGLAVGAVGSVVIIAVEVGLGIDTGSGALDAIVHIPLELGLALGALLFAGATLRAGILPHGGAALLLVGTLLVLARPALTGVLPAALGSGPAVLFGLGWAWLGHGLRAERAAVARRPAVAAA